MAAIIHVLCPVCRFVIRYDRDPDRISNTTAVDSGPCAKCREKQRRQAVAQAESERALDDVSVSD